MTTPVTFANPIHGSRHSPGGPDEIPSLFLKTTLAGTTPSSGTGDTKLLSLRVPADEVLIGDTFDIECHGISSSTGTLTFKLHIGAAGTTADTTAWTSITSAAQVANQRAGVNGLVAVRAVGSGGSSDAEALAYAHAALLPAVVAAAATAAMDTTAPWYITLSVACSVGTFTAQSIVIRKV